METGFIAAFAGATAPTGYALCDGSELNRTTEAALFAVIGTSYGEGDGSATFNVPDLQGRTPVGATGTHPLAERYGAETVTLTDANIPPHNHLINAYNAQGTTHLPENAYPAADVFDRSTGLAVNASYVSQGLYDDNPTLQKTLNAGSVASTGGANDGNGNIVAQPFSIVQPALSVSYVIKL